MDALDSCILRIQMGNDYPTKKNDNVTYCRRSLSHGFQSVLDLEKMTIWREDGNSTIVTTHP